MGTCGGGACDRPLWRALSAPPRLRVQLPLGTLQRSRPSASCPKAAPTPAVRRVPEVSMPMPTDLIDPASANGSSVPQALPQETEHLLNGDANGLGELLHALQAMRIGDF